MAKEEQKKITFVVLSDGTDGLCIAYRLQCEGHDVIVGQVQDRDELKNGAEKEEPEEKKLRLSLHDGMLNKKPAKELVRALLKVPNKDDYFIFCDRNTLWFYAEILVKAGFKNGLLPTQKDYEFEKSREDSMNFVEEYYKGIDIIPFHEFSKTDEALKFLEENPGVYVLQSEGDYVSTIVPTSDDPELASEQVKNQMVKNRASYDKGGLILKEKLINPVEFTPQIVFYNGEPVFTDLDLETKNIGDGNNNGNQVGCGNNLIIATEMKDKINEIAFPPIVYEMAKKHIGLFVWDISLYLHEDKLYFGEFCSNRLGYDASMTEMDMSDGVGNYFLSIKDGKNPLKYKFGISVGLFNLKSKGDIQIICEDVEEHVWLSNVKMVEDEIVSVGLNWDLAAVTASDDSLDKCIDLVYNNKDKFVFKEVYSRTKRDFEAEYPTSIMTRFNAINHVYIEAPDFDDSDDKLETIKSILKN